MSDCLTEDEMRLLKTPLAQLSREQRALAFACRERLDAKIRQENKEYGPISIGGLIVISDNLGGVQGVRNPVNGLMYDSKSAYERAVKESGHVIVGNDSSFKEPKKREQRGNYDCRKELKLAMEQTGFSNRKRKGKKK